MRDCLDFLFFCACWMLCWHALCRGRLLHGTTLCTKKSNYDAHTHTISFCRPCISWKPVVCVVLTRNTRNYRRLEQRGLFTKRVITESRGFQCEHVSHRDVMPAQRISGMWRIFSNMFLYCESFCKQPSS